MTIDAKELDDVQPCKGSIDRLKGRKNRIRPWQTELALKDSNDLADRTAVSDTTPINTVLSDTVLSKQCVSSNTVSSNKTISDNTVLKPQHEAVNIVSRPEIAATDIDSKVNTVSNTVLKRIKIKPSFLEVAILKQMILRSNEGVSSFQVKDISKIVDTTLGGARNALNSLKKKHLITNVGFQKGNMIGFTSYKIESRTFEILSRLESGNKNKDEVFNTVSNTVLNDSLVSKKEDLLPTYILTDTLKNIGLTEKHLLRTTRPHEEVQEILFHFTHSCINGEIRSPNKLPVLLSVLNNQERTWISESYLRCLEDDLKKNEERTQRQAQIEKDLGEKKLRELFETFQEQNPGYLMEVKNKNSMIQNNEILGKIAFEQFRENKL